MIESSGPEDSCRHDSGTVFGMSRTAFVTVEFPWLRSVASLRENGLSKIELYRRTLVEHEGNTTCASGSSRKRAKLGRFVTTTTTTSPGRRGGRIYRVHAARKKERRKKRPLGPGVPFKRYLLRRRCITAHTLGTVTKTR